MKKQHNWWQNQLFHQHLGPLTLQCGCVGEHCSVKKLFGRKMCAVSRPSAYDCAALALRQIQAACAASESELFVFNGYQVRQTGLPYTRLLYQRKFWQVWSYQCFLSSLASLSKPRKLGSMVGNHSKTGAGSVAIAGKPACSARHDLTQPWIDATWCHLPWIAPAAAVRLLMLNEL